MPTYHVPAERRTLPVSDPLRWFLVTVDAPTPCDANRQAERDIRAILGRSANVTIWAAVTYIPDFKHMAEMRAEFDAISDRKKNLHRERTAKLANSFNTFSAAVLA